MMTVRALLASALMAAGGCAAVPSTATAQEPAAKERPAFLTLDALQRDTFDYFWDTTDAENGMAPDRYPTEAPASIAAVGFALTSYGVGIERGYITREQAAERTVKSLRFLWELPMGPEISGTAGHKGFFYHFVGMEDGLRFVDWKVELSTVDTALLLGGVLFGQSYFDDEDDAREAEIRDLAEKIYRRVDWTWAQNNDPLITLGWHPENGGEFIPYDWVGYNEAMLVYILALGSPTHPVGKDAWDGWVDHYGDDWGGAGGLEHLTFAPMFGHQYTHAWIDFRGIQDEYMAEKGSDYFKNSAIAAYAQRAYAAANPAGWKGYSEDIWGITASDGPGEFRKLVKGELREFRGYSARGVALNHSFDDGTLAPTALGGSLPFAPEIIIPAMQAIYDQYGEHLYSDYGFLDAFNPTFQFDEEVVNGKVVPGVGWIAGDYIGIDQGAMLLMAENMRSQIVWETMKKNPHVRRGLVRAGFKGGWLEE